MITITTVEELQAISNDMTADYELGCDIDLRGVDWIPLGASATQSSTSHKSFTGTFNGNGHTIKNLTISRNTTDTYNFVGLFARIGGTIQNLVIQDANINVKGYNPVVGILGGRVFYETNTPQITKVSVSGTITVEHDYTYDQYGFVGVSGFIGSIYNGSQVNITDCISKVDINISGCSNRECYVAGFISYGDGVKLTRCYAFGNINVTNTEDTLLKISGMQPLCYNTTHINCACAVNIIGASSSTVSQCCKYLTSTSSFTDTNSRYYWVNATVSWESYVSSTDKPFNEADLVNIIGEMNIINYDTTDLDFANGKYLKLDIDQGNENENENESVSYDIVIGNTTYVGVKRVIYNNNVLNKLVVGTTEYVFGN